MFKQVRGEMELSVTISLERKRLQKAKILAARQSTSISSLLAEQIEVLVGEEEEYERAEGPGAA